MLKKNTTTTTVQLAWKLLFLGCSTVLKLWSIGGKTRKQAQPAYDDITLMTSIGMQSWLLLGKWRYQTDRKKDFWPKPNGSAYDSRAFHATLHDKFSFARCFVPRFALNDFITTVVLGIELDLSIKLPACLPASRQTIGLAGPDQPMASTY